MTSSQQSAVEVERLARVGAENALKNGLHLRASETVHVMTWGASVPFEAFASVAGALGARLVHVPLEGLASVPPDQQPARLADWLTGATATIALLDDTVPFTISRAAAESARRNGARHLHLPRADARVLATSIRADPDRIDAINTRLLSQLPRPVRVVVTSDAGTRIDVSLSARFELQSGDGRPGAGSFETLPSGYVYTHPASVTGTYVADRVVYGNGVHPPRGAVRRTPVRVRIQDSAVVQVTCDDDALRASVETFLSLHEHTARVGLITFATNPLAVSELGHDIHDSLMPGCSVSLGWTDSPRTRAPFDAPAQLRLVGRRQTIVAGRTTLVKDGRWERVIGG